MKFRVKSTLKYSVQRMTPTKAVRIALLVISDALILNIASFLALWVRFEFHFEQLVRETEYLNNILRFAPYYTAFGLIIFALFKLYTSLWQFASIDEFLKIILACFIVDAGGYAGMHLMHLGIPRSHPVLNGIFLVIMITGVRFSYRFMRQYRRANNSCRRTMIIGAGQAATVALREFRASTHSENKVVCLIDDDKSKWGQYLLGVKVVGGRGDILGAVKKYDIDEIIMAMPSASIRMRSEILEQMKELCGMAAVSVKIKEQEQGLYVKCKIKTEADMITSVIRGTHTNLVYLEKNGKIIYEKNQENGQASDNALIETLKQMTIAQIRQVADTASEEELHFLMDGVEMNERLAAYSEDKKVGVGIADTLRSEKGSEVLKNDLLTRIMLKVSSAAESRLDGCPLPTMSSSGAGTKGLVVILPVSEAADALGVSMEKKVRALAIAHLVNRYINAYIGKLSPMCSCVMASSTAASVGIAYLLGGSDEQLGYAVRNMSGTVTGMICDGGKVGCAMKVATGSSAALLCALTAVHDAPLRVSDGICAETPEDCIRHMAQIGNQGMAQTDKEIIHIMEQKK